jgi:hypothetical protein
MVTAPTEELALSDEDHAKMIRGAAQALELAVRAAIRAGLEVETWGLDDDEPVWTDKTELGVSVTRRF